MHDPKTVAFDLKIPIGRSKPVKPGAMGFPRYWYLVTIWHVDPERNGDEDSCGWSFAHLDAAEKAAADDLIINEFDNVRSWFATARDDDEAKWQLRRLWRLHKTELRPWWKHPRWHVWHWQIQIHAIQRFKRWAFSRCAGCRKGFTWGYAPTTNQWHGDGPRWFRGERDTYHHGCMPRIEA